MKIDIEKLKAFHKRNALVQGSFGDLKETACLMSALTRRTGFDGCVAEGWPRWLAELGAAIFDSAPPDQMWSRAIGFAEAVAAAEARGADWDQCFRDIRMRAILPIALDAVGEGDQPWRAECRRVIQWSIDRDGQAAWAAWAAWAAKAARAAEAAEAAGAAWATEAAGAAKAARAAKAAKAARAAEAAGAAKAAGAAEAAGAAKAQAWTRIYDTTVAVLRGDPRD